jgi:hypothetical protein
MLPSPNVAPDPTVSLVRLLADRWARVATATVVGITAWLALLVTVVQPSDSWPIEVIWSLPALLAPLVYVVTRVVSRRLLRRSPARWLAERARQVEPRSSAATLVLWGFALPLATSAAFLPSTLTRTEPDPYGLGFVLGMFVILGAWIQPVLLGQALVLGRRMVREANGVVDLGSHSASAPLLGAYAILVLLALVVLCGGAGLGGVALSLAGAGLQWGTLALGKHGLRRRLGREREPIARVLGVAGE